MTIDPAASPSFDNLNHGSVLENVRSKKLTEINGKFNQSINNPREFTVDGVTVNIMGGRETLQDLRWLGEYYTDKQLELDVLSGSSATDIECLIEDAVSSEYVLFSLSAYNVLMKDIRDYGIDCEFNRKNKISQITSATSIDSLLEIVW